MNPVLVVLGIILLAMIVIKERKALSNPAAVLVIFVCCMLIFASILWAAWEPLGRRNALVSGYATQVESTCRTAWIQLIRPATGCRGKKEQSCDGTMSGVRAGCSWPLWNPGLDELTSGHFSIIFRSIIGSSLPDPQSSSSCDDVIELWNEDEN